jgi:uncharacterized lipoprotein YajG
MKVMGIVVSMACLAGCASTTDVATDAAAPAVAKTAKCNRNADAPTGSSITRRDCSANPDVQTVDAKELLEQKRFSMPVDPGRH